MKAKIKCKIFIFRSCGIPGFEQQSEMYVWLQVCDVIVRTCSSPHRLSYQTTDTYAQHGQDLLHRLIMENCLSHFSGIAWSRNEIFKKPTRAELRRGHVRQVDPLNPAQTVFFNINLVDLTSMTIGSFQPRQGKIAMKRCQYRCRFVLQCRSVFIVTTGLGIPIFNRYTEYKPN